MARGAKQRWVGMSILVEKLGALSLVLLVKFLGESSEARNVDEADGGREAHALRSSRRTWVVHSCIAEKDFRRRIASKYLEVTQLRL